MSETDKFFTKVTTRVDRERIFRWLVEGRMFFQVQSEKKEIRLFRALAISDASLHVEPEVADTNFEGGVVVTIDFPEEKYFFKTRMLKTEKGFYLDVSQDIYKLQRRDNFRVALPAVYSAKVEIAAVSDESKVHSFSVVNLSGGGFAIEIGPTDNFNISQGDWIIGHMTMGGGFNKKFYAITRHSRPYGSQGSGLIRVGFEFSGFTEADKREVVSLVMGIYREMFSRFKVESK